MSNKPWWKFWDANRQANARDTHLVHSSNPYQSSDILFPGGRVSRDRAATMSAIHRATSLISGATSDIILDSLRVTDTMTGKGAKNAKADSVLAMLLDSPDGIRPAHQWLEDAMADLLLSGNIVIYIDRSAVNSNRMALQLCNPLNVQLQSLPDGDVKFRVKLDNDPSQVYRDAYPNDLIICRWPRIAGRRFGGTSERDHWLSHAPVTTIGNAIQLALNAENWAGSIFDRSSGTVGADYAITFDTGLGALSPEQQEMIYKSITDWTFGRAPLVLPSGGSIEKLAVDPQNANLLELRRFQIEEVARCYGIPGTLIGATGDGNTWGSSIAELDKAFRRYGLRFHLNRLLEPLSHRLLPYGMRFAVDELRSYRGDATALSAIINACKPVPGGGVAILSQDECRQLVGFSEAFDDDWNLVVNPNPSNSGMENK